MYFLRVRSAFDLTVRVAQFPHPTPLWALGTTATETILLWVADFGQGNAQTLGQHGNLGNPNPLGLLNSSRRIESERERSKVRRLSISRSRTALQIHSEDNLF